MSMSTITPVVSTKLFEETINYKNRMDTYLHTFITPPTQTELRAKHLQLRRESLDGLIKGLNCAEDFLWRLDRNIQVAFASIEARFYRTVSGSRGL